jgi:hypothetical protein
LIFAGGVGSIILVGGRLTNEQGYSIPIKQLTIAWHRSPNLSNLLSYRKSHNSTGLKVWSFIMT